MYLQETVIRNRALTTFDFEAAKQYALDKLESGLSPRFVYHSLRHTRDEVVPATEEFAAAAGIAGEDLLLLRTGAWYHDLGCLVQYPHHEAIGVGIAFTVLPRLGYSPAHLQVVTGLILATKLPQTPRTLMEEILADADLSVLGQEAFFTRNLDLRAEFMALGQTTGSETEWLTGQVGFLKSHRYFTEAARQLRDPGKQANLEQLNRLLAHSLPDDG